MLAEVIVHGGMAPETALIYIIIAAALLAVAYFAVTGMGIPIPPVVWKILGICLIAAVAILAIRFLFTL